MGNERQSALAITYIENVGVAEMMVMNERVMNCFVTSKS